MSWLVALINLAWNWKTSLSCAPKFRRNLTRIQSPQSYTLPHFCTFVHLSALTWLILILLTITELSWSEYECNVTGKWQTSVIYEKAIKHKAHACPLSSSFVSTVVFRFLSTGKYIWLISYPARYACRLLFMSSRILLSLRYSIRYSRSSLRRTKRENIKVESSSYLHWQEHH